MGRGEGAAAAAGLLLLVGVARMWKAYKNRCLPIVIHVTCGVEYDDNWPVDESFII